jgi:hypothetical protein
VIEREREREREKEKERQVRERREESKSGLSQPVQKVELTFCLQLCKLMYSVHKIQVY